MCQQGFKRKHLVLKLQIIVSLRDQAAYYGDSDCQSALVNGPGWLPPVWPEHQTTAKTYPPKKLSFPIASFPL